MPWIYINTEALSSSLWVYSIASSNVTVKDIYKWWEAHSTPLELFDVYLDDGKLQKERAKAEEEAQTGFDPCSAGTRWVSQEEKVNKLTITKSELKIADSKIFPQS